MNSEKIQKIGFEPNKEKPKTNDSFGVLDNVDFKKAIEWNEKSVILEITNEIIQNIRESEVGNMIREEMKNKEILDSPSDSPSNFNEMLDTSMGSSWQRLQKWYIKTENPERTKKFLELIGVAKYRQVVRNVIIRSLGKNALKKHKIENPNKNTNYTLANKSLNSLIDFAINQTLFNEKVHLVGGAFCAIGIAESASSGTLALSIGTFLLNLYCVLAQRYTRAQLGPIIDRGLKNHADFDKNKYENNLNIRLPK